jgi:hypothetical protein
VSRRWQLGSVFVLRHAGFPFEMLERLGYSDGVAEAIEAVLAGGGEEAWRELEARLAPDLVELRRRLREAASDPLVQEAVFMSNPAVFEQSWLRYLERGDERPDAEHRRRERLVYTYLQRLCGKNETASFFGPMGYGEVEGEGWAEVERAGRPRRRVLFAHWAAEELAQAMGEDRDLAPHLPLTLNPLFCMDGGSLRRRGQEGTVRLSQPAALLLSAVAAGKLSLVQAAAAAGLGREEAERAIGALLRAGVLRRGPVVEGEDVDLLSQLRRVVETLPGPGGERWRGRLGELSRLALDFQAGDLGARRRLLPEIESRFSAWTGASPRRGEGRIYADRLVLFEEAESPFRLRAGRRLVRWLEESLSDALDLSSAYGALVQAGYRAQAARRLAGLGIANLLDYVATLPPEELHREQALPRVPAPVLAGTDSAALDAGLCGPPGPGPRYALLDVCLCSSAPDRSGRPPAVVLSRLHHQLLLWSWLTMFHPDRERVEASARGWLAARPGVLAALVTRRHNKSFYSYPGRRVSLDVQAPPRPDTVMASEVRVLACPEGPELRDSEGGPLRLYLPLADHSTVPALAALADPLVLHAPIGGDVESTPRLMIGSAVYQRRRWRASLGHLRGRRDAGLLVEVARLRRRDGWPRFVYVRLPEERKPYLVDLECPFACELLKHLAGQAETVTLEEMLPGPSQLWLRDERGRYSCELRWQAVRIEDVET